jgi:ribonuclease BN (tRNA processing enzyme)
MKVVVQGTNEFNEYQIFLRAMGIALSSMQKDDEDYIVYSVGPVQIQSFVSEFCNVSEKGLKARGIKVKFYKTNPQWIEENMNDINYFAYFSKPNQHISKLASLAQSNNVELNVFSY